MKKLLKFSGILVTSSLLLLSSCNDKKNQQQTSTTENQANSTTSSSEEISYEEDTSSKSQSSARKSVNAVLIYNGWGLFTEKDGKMISAEQTVSGTAVTAFMEDGKVYSKMAVRKLQNGKEDTFSFVLVNVDGKEYWTRDIYITTNGHPAIVTKDDTRIFSAADFANATTKTLKKGDMVAMSGNESGFDKIITFNEKKPFGQAQYIKEGTTSTDVAVIDSIATSKKISDLGDKINPKVYAEIMEMIH